jgi:hypothetical protein
MSSGDQCPKCRDGQMRVRTSRQVGNCQVQSLECNRCGEKHEDKVVVPVAKVFKRG